MRAVTVAQMKAIEQSSVDAGVSLDTLMENAGLAVAEAVSDEMDGAYGKRVVTLIGPGNNGSDGLVAARHLSKWGATVRAFLCTKRPDVDEKRELAEVAGVEIIDACTDTGPEHLSDAVRYADVIVDAVLGAGSTRPIEAPLSDLLFTALQSAKPVIAIDVPTGLNSDTGQFEIHGLPADTTLMLGHPKIGVLVSSGEGVSGEPKVLDIGIPEVGMDCLNVEWLTEELAISLMPERASDSNKGSFGKALIVAGSPNYLGAALLSTSAATHSGAGLVSLATREPVYELIAGKVEEAIYLPLPCGEGGQYDVRNASIEILGAAWKSSALLLGPGLGQGTATVQLVEQLTANLPAESPVVLDADALNILARAPRWWERIKPPKILTPHPGEMARLSGKTVSEVQNSRLDTATEAANKFNATVVLKGAATIIASPDGQARISPWVNPGLAKGGTGDVLAGLMAGLLAQMPDHPFDAASLAVYVHGLAAEIAKDELGEIGMRAGDVDRRLPAALKRLAG